MIRKIRHVGIAVKSVESSIALFERLLGTISARREAVPDQKVNAAFISLGETSLELLEATSSDSAIAKFLDQRGEGIHHLSIEVDNIEEELLRLRNQGFQLIDERPRPGAGNELVAFLHPKSTNGVLVEISQKRK